MIITVWLLLGFFAGVLVMILLERYKNCVDQTTDAAHEPHPCSSCPVRNVCSCDYSDSDALGCQGDYHCPEKVTQFDDPGACS